MIKCESKHDGMSIVMLSVSFCCVTFILGVTFFNYYVESCHTACHYAECCGTVSQRL